MNNEVEIKKITDEFKTWYNEQDTDLTITDIIIWWKENITQIIKSKELSVINLLKSFEFDSGFETTFNKQYRQGKEDARVEIINYLISNKTKND